MWSLEPFAVLDASPLAWVLEKDRLFVLTNSGLWETTADTDATQSHRSDFGQRPGSLARTSDGVFYAGMGRYLVRWQPTDDSWSETWLVHSGCKRARLVNYDCRCLE